MRTTQTIASNGKRTGRRSGGVRIKVGPRRSPKRIVTRRLGVAKRCATKRGTAKRVTGKR